MDPVNAADCRLLLSLLKYAIVAPDQRERVEDWLRAKESALTGMERLEVDIRALATTNAPVAVYRADSSVERY